MQNGKPTGKSLTPVAPLYLHDGRGLASYTHDDVLYQAYFIAYLVLSSLNVPLNPGNPYRDSQKPKRLCDIRPARYRGDFDRCGGRGPEGRLVSKMVGPSAASSRSSGGAIVHLAKTGAGGTQGQVSNTALQSQAVHPSFTTNHSYLLSQAFPEGSPTHPAYPTGHGTVGGACITALKFFYDGTYKIFQGRRNLFRPVTGPAPARTLRLPVSRTSRSMENCISSRTTSASAMGLCRNSLAERY